MEDIKLYLERELCADDNHFNMPFIAEYLHSCNAYDVFTEDRVTIHYMRKKEHAPDLNFLKKVATRINVTLYYFNYKGPHITFWIIPCPQRRKFPENGEIFAPVHVNGAYTYVDGKAPRIYVYRSEEMAKVMLHEVCHHLSMHSTHWNGTALLCKAFGIANDNNMVLANEAVVEFWAEILHCCFVATEHKKKAIEYVQKEVDHALTKTRKILEHKEKLGTMWHENTNAFSYFVWRTVLLYYRVEFLTNFSMPYNTEKVSNFLINKFSDSSFQRALKHAKVLKGNNMRMTVYGDL